MAKKTNKTSHVLNLITGSQPPVASSGETQPSSSASGGEHFADRGQDEAMA